MTTTTAAATTCYICYEEASADHPFLTAPVCACKGSLTLHRICYEQIRLTAPTTSTCSVCKQLYNDPEMYETFDETNSDYMRYIGRRHKLTGQLDGPYTTYYSNGAIWFQTTYCNGQRNGSYTEYYEDGQLERAYTYKNGEIHGSYMQYYEDGSICIEAEYANDERHGYYKEYYRSGALAYDYTYIEGYKCGDCIAYYETGAKRQVTTYDLNGAVVYKIVHYYESGNMEAVYIYSENEELVQKIEYYDMPLQKGFGTPNGMASEQIYAYGKCVHSSRWCENGERIP